MKVYCLIFILVCNVFAQINKNININTNLQDIFNKYNIQGVFIINMQGNIQSNNAKRAKVRYMPASTFKIYNALFGLDLGVVRDNKEIFYR